jgi:hypothetical protein
MTFSILSSISVELGGRVIIPITKFKVLFTLSIVHKERKVLLLRMQTAASLLLSAL